MNLRLQCLSLAPSDCAHWQRNEWKTNNWRSNLNPSPGNCTVHAFKVFTKRYAAQPCITRPFLKYSCSFASSAHQRPILTQTASKSGGGQKKKERNDIFFVSDKTLGVPFYNTLTNQLYPTRPSHHKKTNTQPLQPSQSALFLGGTAVLMCSSVIWHLTYSK